MHPSTNCFLFLSLVVLSFNSKDTQPLLLSNSSETRLFELHSLPNGYLTFVGDSHLQHRAIALTREGMLTNAPRSAGVVFYRQPILFLDPHSKKVRSFYTMFAFSIQNYGDGEAPGDGLAFLISQNDDLLGSPGYLGLVDSTDLTRNKFIAIEFDTKCDSIFHDPDDNHVGLDINNLSSVKLATSSALRSLDVNLKSGYPIITWIDYKSDEKRLEIFLSKSYLKPSKPILKVDIDLSNYLKDEMFVGFSAATKGTMQLTHIEHWEFTIMKLSPPPPPPPPAESGITFSNPPDSRQRHKDLSKFAIGLAVGVCSVPFLGLIGWYCWKKFIGIIQKSEGTNNVERQNIRTSGGKSCQEIQLSILVGEVAGGLHFEKVLDNVAELIRVKKVKSSLSPCNSLPAVKPCILPLCKNLPLRTNDIT
ncbi:probable L-type lectin-domain containing receptor kinase S.7 [Coffea eugenioides]|uniref:probable L-type lectin-domain containing receptor kinase S.7 n=1 Tax=Coffea eugenioides TaxID=49369 RepID=UPI000F606285|nr:probable L-type lectin-domain containing receptor kinase S.7 [Coffea eugenioides]